MSEIQKKTKVISFRISEEEFTKIEKAASGSGKNPTDWCRDLVLHEAGEGKILSANDKIVFEEIAKIRYLIGIGFGLLSTDELNKENWQETKFQVDNLGEKIAAQLLAKRGK